MHTVLDLDLDVFVCPTATCPQWKGRAPDHYEVASIDDVRCFLEERCHLGEDHKILGAEVVDHDDAFWTWKRWIAEGKLSPPFRVVHVDAHADIGCGDVGFRYLLAELLALPVEQRSTPLHGRSGMNLGNCLTFVVANQWARDILYVYPRTMRLLNAHGAVEKGTPENKNLSPGDLPTYYFRDFAPLSRMFELKHYTKEDAEILLMTNRRLAPVRIEPAIPFDWCRVNDSSLADSPTSLSHSLQNSRLVLPMLYCP